MTACGGAGRHKAEADTLSSQIDRSAHGWFRVIDSSRVAQNLSGTMLGKMKEDSVFWKHYQPHTVNLLDSLFRDMQQERQRADHLETGTRRLINQLETLHSDAEQISARIGTGKEPDDVKQELARLRKQFDEVNAQLQRKRDSVAANHRWMRATHASFTYYHDSALLAVQRFYHEKYGRKGN